MNQKGHSGQDSPVASGSEAPSPGVTASGVKHGLLVLLLLELVLGILLVPVTLVFQLNWIWVLLAWAVCLVSALLAHVASEFPKGDEFVLLRLVSGMACRTVLPLLVAVGGLNFREPPMDRSIVLVLVVCYLVGLMADTVLTAKRLGSIHPKT